MDRADHDEEGFTLIELMVVVLVIAILLAIAVPTFMGARSRASMATTKSRVHSGLMAIAGFRSSSGALVSDPALLQLEEPSQTWVATAPTGNAIGVAGDGSTAIVVARPAGVAASAQRGCVSMSYSDRGPGDVQTDSLCDPVSLLMSITGAPMNLVGRGDNFADAADLPPLPVGTRALASIDLAGTTSEAGEPWPWTTGASMWLRYTPEVNQTLQLNMAALASGGEARISVYTGSSLASLVNVTYGYNGATFNGVANTTYYFRIGTQSVLGGPTTVTLRAGSAAADDFGVSTIVAQASGGSTTVSYNLANATIQPGEPWLNPGSYVTNWFDYTPTVNQTIQLVLTGGTTGPRYIAVYTGGTIATQTPLIQTSSGVGFTAVAGVTYHLQVGTTLAEATGTGTLTLRAGSSGADDFGATAIAAIASGASSTTSYNLVNATIQPNEPWLNAGSYVSNWFTYTPTVNQTVQVLATGGTNGTRYIAAYTGNTLGALTPILQTSNGTAFNAIAGTTYHIQVGTELASPNGTGTLTLRAGSLGADDFTASTIVAIPSGTSTTATYDLNNATIQPGEPWLNAGSYVSNWFTYTPTVNQTIQVIATGGTNGTRYIAAYTGSTLNSLTTLTQTSNGISIAGVAGVTYHFQIGTQLGSASGTGTVTIRAGSSGADDFAATTISAQGPGVSSSTSYNLANATIQPNEPWLNPGSYVSNWFDYTPTINQTIQVTVTGGTSGPRYLAAYTGSSLGTLTALTQTTNSITISVVAGVTYHLMVGTTVGDGAGTGTIAITT
ncbi:MAG: prepilin-type N-terminal cleavage/methylation domain-containing protein [Acidimicrobiia bacterium]